MVGLSQGECRLVPYADIYAPTGYGFKSHARAERKADEIESQLEQQESK